MTSYKKVEGLHLGQIIDQVSDSDREAIVFNNQRITYSQLSNLINSMAYSLQQKGLNKGDRFAIAIPNSPELVVTFYALAKIGCIITWINPSYRGRDFQLPLQKTKAKGVIINAKPDGFDYLGMIQNWRSELSNLEIIISINNSNLPPGIECYDELLKADQGQKPIPVEIDPRKDYATIIFTSGATSVPKGAPSTHYQCIRESFSYSNALQTNFNDVFLAALAMYHSYGFICLLVQVFIQQAKMVIMEEWDVAKALELIEVEKITAHPAAPTHYLTEMKHPDFNRRDLSSLQKGFISGYVPPNELFEEIERKYPNMWFCNFWGSSETGPGLISPHNAPKHKRYYTVGKPTEGEDVQIVNPETGLPVQCGETGELMVRGYNVIKEYWNNPKETQKHLEKEGWFHTGDLAVLDEDGYVTIVGRIKDQINRGGFKIIPKDVEEEIVKHPLVEEAVLVGTPNPFLGENICACVITKGNCFIAIEELREFLKDKLARNKLPDELILMEEFPKLSGGVKINKYGAGGVLELALADPRRQNYRERKKQHTG